MTGKLKKMTANLGLEDNVVFTGFIDNSKIYDFIGKHHFMVMPSIMDSESFGVAILEAAACARPSVATRVGGVPEVIKHDKTGILIAPRQVDALSEAILKLACVPEMLHKMGQAAYENVRTEFPWSKSLDLMAELYERLLYEKK